MNGVTSEKLAIGTWVNIRGGGVLKGLVVDYVEDRYVIAFSDGREFIFAASHLTRVN